ncbi:MAG: hypothetical protein Q7J27_12060 [Syntrophales bacterium]|nr:hypothetical protein [Syntrophales bacterium]
MGIRIAEWEKHEDTGKGLTTNLTYVGSSSHFNYNIEESEGFFGATLPGTTIISYDPRVDELKKEIKELKEMFVQLNEKIGLTEVEEIEIRDISLKQAKEEIALYFRDNDGKEIGYEDIVETLGIDPHVVVHACNELVKEKKIG